MKKLIQILNEQDDKLEKFKYWIKNVQKYKTFLPKKILALLFVGVYDHHDKKWQNDLINNYDKILSNSIPIKEFEILNINPIGKCEENSLKYGKENNLKVVEGYIILCDKSIQIDFNGKMTDLPRIIWHTFNIDNNMKVFDSTKMGYPKYIEYRIKK